MLKGLMMATRVGSWNHCVQCVQAHSRKRKQECSGDFSAPAEKLSKLASGSVKEDSNGRTALMVMLDTAVWEYNLKRLLKSGSNVNAESADAMSGIGSWTAIQRAAAYWSVEMM